MSYRDKVEGMKRHLKLLRCGLCDIIKPKSQGQRGAAWTRLPHQSLKHHHRTGLHAIWLLVSTKWAYHSPPASDMINKAKKKKREQRQKIAMVQFASILPKGMFEITVRLEWEWNLIKVQTSQSAVLFLPRRSHWRFFRCLSRVASYADAPNCHFDTLSGSRIATAVVERDRSQNYGRNCIVDHKNIGSVCR